LPLTLKRGGWLDWKSSAEKTERVRGSMIEILKTLIAGAVVLGILVLLHEWGHFVAAKLCGVRVDVFSIGFGPRIWGVKRGDTDYRLSALPLGGYVRMAGDNPVEERTGAPYEFLSRPRWQRFIIAVAGPITNIVLTFLIFWGIYAFAGLPVDTSVLQPADVVAVPQKATKGIGVQPGDRIVKVNGVDTPTWEKVFEQAAKSAPGSSLSVVVARGGAEQPLTITPPQDKTGVDNGLGYRALPPVADDIAGGLPAEKAGMKAGDTIIAINGEPIVTWLQLVEGVRGSGGHLVHFVVRRDGKDIALDITPVDQMTPDGEMNWQIGVAGKTEETYQHQNIVEAAKGGVSDTLFYARLIGDVVVGLFRGRVSVHDLAGPVRIVQMSGQAAKRGPLTLLKWIAYISLDLGLLNLLPIPILDGGHVLLLAIEGTLRRDLSITVKERFVQVGLVFLLGLFAFVMYSDILSLVQRH
jgi:regulator of sigma E protease